MTTAPMPKREKSDGCATSYGRVECIRRTAPSPRASISTPPPLATMGGLRSAAGMEPCLELRLAGGVAGRMAGGGRASSWTRGDPSSSAPR
eukprot:scaffold32666_cov51-Phaeocystis_antarctica.AAC.1